MPETFDHEGKPVSHGRARVNGIRMHYITAGQGPALVLLHGTPKTHYYWYRLIPHLTPHFTVVAPDLRGFGATDKPPASEGYDSGTNASDISELMTQLSHAQFYVHGEDRGGSYAYALASQNRDRVLGLSFCEMLLSDDLTRQTCFTPENISAQYEQRGVWNWHVPFFWLPHVPEMLIQGKEREFWTMFMVQECYNPDALEEGAVEEWVRQVRAPGGLRGVLETYRSHWKNVEVESEGLKVKLPKRMRVMTVGAPEFFGPLVESQMKKAAEEVFHAEVFERCGHSLSLEAPDRMAAVLKKFLQ
ncbi:alpha/beta hydrolase fold-containing protein 23 [Elsinoe australis]|uniref:Alpha/beta hydrolase fold-containing protein 23 n=1 Tax=Elsinoe australis TaxID=40998 RepID=A0A4U7AXJ3_9PEZI|nr:alpha/beta hydrolase fold-containing protein 23 [Elsinoe australis]